MFRSERTTSGRSELTIGGKMTDGSGGELVWYRARCDSGACVEVATTDSDAVILRSSANPDDTPVTLSRNEWEEFLAGAKEGAFDMV
jgi:Domain of unknown function (DUF397)